MMTSNKPYIIRAFYDWFLDNNVTPYIVIDASLPFVTVPDEYVVDDKITLNIQPSAVENLILGNDWISFSTRFSGIPFEVSIPVGAVIAIFSQENGHGLQFPPEALSEEEVQEDFPIKKSITKKGFSVIDSQQSPDSNEDETPPPSPKKKSKKKSTLTIVK